MVSETNDYIKRIEALNGGPLQNRIDPDKEVESVRRWLKKRKQGRSQETPPSKPVEYKRDLPRVEHTRRSHHVPDGPPVVLEEAVTGIELAVPGRGQAYLVETRVSDVEEITCPLCEMFCDKLSQVESPLRKRLSLTCGLDELVPHDVLFVDTETTGLGSSPLFLVGIMLWEGDGLVVRQYLARSYAEESAVTALFMEEALGKKLLVSFNGKSFDLPYIRVRAAANGVPFKVSAAHLDLLHHSRRIWKSTLPNCKLQTLEKHICGRCREGDIPGAEIPEAYHSYVRTSNAVQIVEILKHNMLDLVTLADLMVRLPEMG